MTTKCRFPTFSFTFGISIPIPSFTIPFPSFTLAFDLPCPLD